jgi:hypothetical protein
MLVRFNGFIIVGMFKRIEYRRTRFWGIATGSLLDSSSVCKSATIKGQYKELETLTDSNYVLVSVNFTTQGKYNHFYRHRKWHVV